MKLQSKSLAGVSALFAMFLFSRVARADTYDIYVNAAAVEGQETGSAEQPFNTIAEAITAASSRSAGERRIYVANGTYVERFVLGESMKLTGESREGVIIDGGDSKTIVTMQHNTELRSVTLDDSRRGVAVEKNSKALIKDCIIKNARDIGVEVAKTNKSTRRTTVADCKITSGGKGIYVNDEGIADINDNKIYDNNQEGIDIRSKTKGTVQGNEVYDNGEGGIEVIIGKSSVKIKNNELRNNGASGVAVQYYKSVAKKGKISLTNNTIKKNSHYGIVCNNPLGGKPSTDYYKKNASLKNNTIDQDEKYGTMCYFGKK